MERMFPMFDIKAYEEMAGGRKVWFYHIEREETEKMDFTRIDSFMNGLEKLKKKAHNRVLITFSGYDDTKEEIWEIDEIRTFVEKFVTMHPHIFYFLSEELEAKQVFLSCYTDLTAFSRGER